MKMKKSTWLLLVLAIAAIFLVAGCAPTGPAPTPPDENGEEPPPTPPADTACPKVVNTRVSKLFDPDGAANFQIVITFDEDFNSSCIQNPALWTIAVANADRVGTPVVSGVSVSVSGKVVTIQARVVETGEDVVIVDDYRELFGAIADALKDEDIDAVIDALEDLIAALGRLDEESYEALIAALDEDTFGDLVIALGCLAGLKDLDEDLADALENLAEGLGGAPMAQNALIAALEDLVDALEGASHYDLVTLLESNCVVGEEVLVRRSVEVGLIDALDDLLCCSFVREYTITGASEFAGLICNKDDAEAYEEEFGLAADTVKFADEVSWKLTNCAVYDELGNVCCDFSGKDCCVEPYCEECPPEGCPITEAGACL